MNCENASDTLRSVGRCFQLSRITILTAALTAFACASFASAPIANLSSPQGFYLDGHPVAAAGVSSWPLVLGDEVTTSGSTATMLFQDGSRVKLAPQSRVKISGTTAKPQVLLVAGSLDYRLTPGSSVLLAKAGQPQNNTGQANPPVTAYPQVSSKRQIIEGVLIAGGLAAVALIACWGAGCFSGSAPISTP